MSLLFLRPSPPQSINLSKTFTRGIANVRTPGSRASGGGPARHSNAPKRRRETTPNTTTIGSTSSAASSAPEPPAPTTPGELSPLPYYVGRTPSEQLPVYHLAKRGGNLHQTLVKKIQGDVHALKKELKEVLQLDKEHITVNPINNSIIMKGWLRSEVADFLRKRHF